MRKKIGVFVGNAPNEYPKEIIKTIYKEANELGYDVFVFGVYGSQGDNLLFAEGEKQMFYLPDLAEFDGIISCEDTFDIEGVEPEVDKLLLEKAKCPVVYLRRQKEPFYSVAVRGQEAMAEMVRHFVVKHGCRDICFMQGPMIYEDARERYEGFEQVCREFDIPVTEHMVYEGNYWRDKAKEAIDWFTEGRTTYPQAIICANDYMAISICDELKARGLRIPEDILVSGFDDTMEARRYIPSISSIRVDFTQMASKAVAMIDRINRGEPQEKCEFVYPEVKLYKSCGCGEQIYLDDWSDVLTRILTQEDNMRKIVFMTTDFQGVYEEDEYFRYATKYFARTNAKKAYLCLCMDEQSDDTDQRRMNYSEQMILKRIYADDNPYVICDEVFDRRTILPEHYLEESNPGGYLVLSIHHKNKIHGYFVFEYDEDKWIDGYTQPFITCLANVIEDTEVHKQMEDMETIKNLYQIDPLTGIYNRRGFEAKLHALYDEAKQTGEYLSIVSIDMDRLKYINDSFGHAEGDFALTHLAMVLKKVVGDRQICARVGGDEYNAILISSDRESHDRFAQEFLTALKEEEERVQKPYPIRASVGVCCINDFGDISLMGCLQQADALMYENKRARKKAEGENPR